MELKLYLDILARRWKIALLTALMVFCLAIAASLVMHPKYQAVTMLRVITPVGGSSGDVNYQTTFAVRLVNTYAQIAVSEQVKNTLKEKLGLQELPDISVKIIPDSEIIQIIVESQNPVFAAKVANALADILLSHPDTTVNMDNSEELAILSTHKNELQAALTDYQKQHDQLVQQYSQTASDMAVLDGAIKLKQAAFQNLQDQYEQTIVAEAVFANSNTKATKNALEKEIERIGKELNDLNIQYKDLSARSSEYLQQISLINQMIQSTQSAYSNLLAQYDNVSLANLKQENAQNIEIASPAFEPVMPSSPSRAVVVCLGFIIAVISGVIVAFLVDNLDPRIYSTEQLEHLVSIPLVGSISKYPQGRKNISNDSDPASEREYLLFCARVQTMIKESSVKSILLTSPNRGEGKSTITYQLALGLAQYNFKILVVDADMYIPKQLSLFNVSAEQGLCNYLSGDTNNLEGLILKEVRPGIDLLPNLNKLENSIELIKTPRLNALLDIFTRYEIVLLDTPAFLSVPDTFAFSRIVEGVIAIVQSGHTTTKDIQTTCQNLTDTGSKIFGLVINKVPAHKSTNSYKSKTIDTHHQPEAPGASII
jgi:polysaccharide biosynthesis transport protein